MFRHFKAWLSWFGVSIIFGIRWIFLKLSSLAILHNSDNDLNDAETAIVVCDEDEKEDIDMSSQGHRKKREIGSHGEQKMGAVKSRHGGAGKVLPKDPKAPNRNVSPGANPDQIKEDLKGQRRDYNTKQGGHYGYEKTGMSTKQGSVDISKERERYILMSAEDKKREKFISTYVSLDSIPSYYDTMKGSQKGSECDKYAKKISIWSGNIVALGIDAIVNAANTHLGGGGGVDGAIHRAAGPLLLKENREIHKRCPTGEACTAAGYKLAARYIIHTVGPTDGNGAMLTKCYENCLAQVKEHGIRSVAFPGIATGIYGFPLDKATDIALKVTRDWLEQNYDEVDRIIFCTFLQEADMMFHEKTPLYFCRKATEHVQDESMKKRKTAEDSGKQECGNKRNEPSPNLLVEKDAVHTEESENVKVGSRSTQFPKSFQSAEPSSVAEGHRSNTRNLDEDGEPELHGNHSVTNDEIKAEVKGAAAGEDENKKHVTDKGTIKDEQASGNTNPMEKHLQTPVSAVTREVPDPPCPKGQSSDKNDVSVAEESEQSNSQLSVMDIDQSQRSEMATDSQEAQPGDNTQTEYMDTN